MACAGRSTPGLLLAAALLVVGIGADMGTRTGHRTGRASRGLSALTAGSRCGIHAPRGDSAERGRLLRDCGSRRSGGAASRRQYPARLRRSSSSATKGARRTTACKAWRDEVYLQLGDWPHPVLAHGSCMPSRGPSTGPLSAGSLGGWLQRRSSRVGRGHRRDARDDLTADEAAARLLDSARSSVPRIWRRYTSVHAHAYDRRVVSGFSRGTTRYARCAGRTQPMILSSVWRDAHCARARLARSSANVRLT